MKFFLIFILISFLVTWIIKGVLVYLSQAFYSKVFQGPPPQQTQHTRKNTGKGDDIHIENVPNNQKKIRKDMGEYVDYEEIK